MCVSYLELGYSNWCSNYADGMEYRGLVV